ncbi:MAG: hypothetical protein WD100_11760 [Tistlia sp.]|uniref:hypothetical protein n=1 Tax=Tistlia sp. TaxID=3057121 RepID=UPI0034A19F08
MEGLAERLPAEGLEADRLPPETPSAPVQPRTRILEVPRGPAPAPANDLVSAAPSNERSLGEELHPACYAIIFGAALWIVGVYGLAFAAAPQALMMVGVSLSFLLVYGGLPLVMWRSRPLPQRARRTGGFGAFARSRVETWTGAIHGREATTQMAMIPVALALAATGTALAIAAAR